MQEALSLQLGLTINWPSARFCLDFQESVDIFSEQPVLLIFKVPDFKDLHNPVTTIQCFVQLRCAPRACDLTLFIGVVT